jgi:hypothetical protein
MPAETCAMVAAERVRVAGLARQRYDIDFLQAPSASTPASPLWPRSMPPSRAAATTFHRAAIKACWQQGLSIAAWEILRHSPGPSAARIWRLASRTGNCPPPSMPTGKSDGRGIRGVPGLGLAGGYLVSELSPMPCFRQLADDQIRTSRSAGTGVRLPSKRPGARGGQSSGFCDLGVLAPPGLPALRGETVAVEAVAMQEERRPMGAIFGPVLYGFSGLAWFCGYSRILTRESGRANLTLEPVMAGWVKPPHPRS